jgi:hypothetical protein
MAPGVHLKKTSGMMRGNFGATGGLGLAAHAAQKQTPLGAFRRQAVLNTKNPT